MAKFFGKIGFGITKEEPENSGIWINQVVEKPYCGEVYRVNRKSQNGEGVNDNVDINNEISILSDPFAMNYIANILYVEWYAQKWKVSSVTVEYPRLRLSVGGVWNGNEVGPSSDSCESDRSN